MSNEEIGSLALALCVLIGAVHIFGYLFDKLRQPRLIGEILAGFILGPQVLGAFAPNASAFLFGPANGKTGTVLGFCYWVGLFLLMFLSGSEIRQLVAKENRKETLWMFGIGTILPFILVVGAGLASLIPLDQLRGTIENDISTLLVVAVATSITSIPVISRIFIDLKIIKTRFATLILSFAVLEDIVLWAVLAVATGVAKQGSAGAIENSIAAHVGLTFLCMILGLTLVPRLLAVLGSSRFNLLFKASPVGYLFCILFVYAAIAKALDINLVFAAFLGGFGAVGGLGGSQRESLRESLDSIARVARGVFIPIYFSLVGYKLQFGHDFSLGLFFSFAIGSSLVAITAFAFAAWCAGFRGLDIVNLAITKNARGGPGIVLASVAYEAGLINSEFYTALVLTAILTSQGAGVWLRFVLSRKWPLLTESRRDSHSALKTRVV